VPDPLQVDERRWLLANVDGGRLVVSGNAMVPLGGRVEVVPASVVAARDEELRQLCAAFDGESALLKHEQSQVAALTEEVERLKAERGEVMQLLGYDGEDGDGEPVSLAQDLHDRLSIHSMDLAAFHEMDEALNSVLDHFDAPQLGAGGSPIGGSLRVEAAFEQWQADRAALERARERIVQIAENRRERDKVFALAETAIAEVEQRQLDRVVAHHRADLLAFGEHGSNGPRVSSGIGTTRRSKPTGTRTRWPIEAASANSSPLCAMNRRTGMPDPLKPSPVVLCHLGSLAVHVEEAIEDGHPFDGAAIQACLVNDEVRAWLEAMVALALVPVKRRGAGSDAG
jgi:hypothetical protein